MIAVFSVLLGLAATLVSAAPAALEGLEARSGVTAVSAAVISDLTPYAQVSRSIPCLVSGNTTTYIRMSSSLEQRTVQAVKYPAGDAEVRAIVGLASRSTSWSLTELHA